MFRRSDKRVIERVLAGHREEYSTLVERYWPLAYSVGFAHAGNYEDARDVAQDALVAAYQKLDSLRERDKFAPWLAAIARNLANRLLAKRRREASAGPDNGPDYVIPDLEAHEMRELVRAELMRMEEGPREVLVLHYFSGMSTREIARTLEIGTAAAEKRLQRARKQLGDTLLEHLREPEEARLDQDRRKGLMGLVLTAPTAWEPAAAAGAGGVSMLLRAARLHIVLPVFGVLLVGSGLFVLHDAGSSSEAEEGPAPAAPEESKPASAAPVAATALHRYAAHEGPAGGAGIDGAQVVRGVVLDMDQLPVSGARVELLEYQPEVIDRSFKARVLQTTTSARDGSFSFAGVSGEYFMLLATTDSAIGSGTWGSLMPQEVTIPMFPASSLAGRVVDAKGAPVAGARVAPVKHMADGEYFPKSTSLNLGIIVVPPLAGALAVETDAGGLFSIPRVWPGEWNLVARADGLGWAEAADVPVGTAGIELVLEPACRIEGTVVDVEGNPVAGAEISGSPGTMAEAFKTVSGEDGRFAVDNLRAGKCGIYATHHLMRLFKPVEPRELSPGETTTYKIVMKKGMSVSGHVTDASTGEPIAGATVEAGFSQTTTDESGYYEAANAEAETLIRVQATGYQNEAKNPMMVPAENLGRQDIQLKKRADYPGSVKGLVVDEAGQPVKFAEVWAGANQSRGTDANGAFYLPSTTPGPFYLFARWFDQASEPLGPFSNAGECPEDVVLTLRGGLCSIRGRVVDRLGKPLTGNDLIVRSNQLDADLCRARSDGIGWFHVRGLFPGTYVIRLDDERLSTGAQAEVELAAGDQVTGLTLTCNVGGELAIEGVVVDDTGKPRPRQSLAVCDKEGMFIHGVASDNNGRFVIPNLKPGIYRVNDQEVEAGTRDVRLVVPRTATVKGKVLQPNGMPAKDFVVGVSCEEMLMTWRPERNYSEKGGGTFELREISPATNVRTCVVARAEGFSPALTLVEDLQPGETRRGVVVKLEPSAGVSGRVVGVDGRPVEGANVVLQVAGHGDRLHEIFQKHELRSGKDGGFEISGLFCRPYWLQARHKEYAPSEPLKVEPVAGRTVKTEVVLYQGGTVRGRVTVGGKPVAGARVIVHLEDGQDQDPEQPSATTGKDGTYEVRGAVPGVSFVWAHVPAAGGVPARAMSYSDVMVEVGKKLVADFDFPIGNAEIKGTVLWNGEVPRGFNVTAQNGRENCTITKMGTSEFRMTGLPPGRWRIDADASFMPGPNGPFVHKPANIEVELTPGQTAVVEFNLND